VSEPPAPRVVKLGDILPVFSTFESILSSAKAYPLWPVMIREALLDRAISGVACTDAEVDLHWGDWCARNGIDPEKPVFEGLSPAEMRKAVARERKIEAFKEQVFGKHLPEYFRARKKHLDRVTLEVVRFHHHAVAEEALFRCREGEQTLEQAAHDLAVRDGGEPPVKRMAPTAVSRLSAGMAALVAGCRAGDFLGPKKIGHHHVVVRVIESREASLDERVRQKLLMELLNQWIEQQMSAMTGRPPRSPLSDEEVAGEESNQDLPALGS
jgi:uncharacterized membrane protein YjdF